VISAPGGGAGVGKASFDPITLKLPSQAALTDLMAALAQGSRLNGVRIEGMAGAGHAGAVYDLSLAGVTITHVTQDDSGGLSVTLNYGAIQLATKGINSDGSLTPTSTFSWDLTQNAPASSAQFHAAVGGRSTALIPTTFT